MPGPVRSTIERLDRPSAYYLGKLPAGLPLTLKVLQNKRRKFNRDRDDRDDRERTPEEPPEDPLKDATTLYVGNL
ncbi:MAG: hypothetical protein LQ348_004036 [Seirophora lacunosa]|nr:MAG: hypothetical protein LQ348_004036 [Seirophora lacunosa]